MTHLSRFVPPAAILGLVICFVLAGCNTTVDRPGGPPARAYETFDTVWSLVDTRHFDPEHNGVDWQAVRETYRPRVSEVRSDAELRGLLGEMVDELGQTHFVIIPREVTPSPTGSDETDPADGDEPAADEEETGSLGIRLAWLEDDVVISRVEPGSEADAAGIRPGWLVEEIKDVDPSARLAPFRQAAMESDTPFAKYESIEVLNTLAQGPVGTSSRLRLRDEHDREIERTLVHRPVSGDRVTFGMLPETPVTIEAGLLSDEELRSLGIEWNGKHAPRIALLRFNIWMFPIMVPIAEAVDRYRDVDGFIIDLRANPGGVGALAMGVAGHFLGTEESLGDMKMRDATMHFRVNPQRATPDGRLVDPFAGPVAVLVDRCSASTSEVFAAGLQQLGRITVVGRPTAGAALPAQFTRLPNDDGFMFAVADFIGPAGSSIEGSGVIPDIHVPIDRERLLAEGDPDLAAAGRWIVSEIDDPTS